MEAQAKELEGLANNSIQQARKTLEEAIRDYPLTDARVQADYLLASLAFESAEQSKDEEIRKKYFVEAISRFNDLIADFPDSEYAPKSQFRKAFVLERVGKIDDACEEYVKLSYRYPDHELVAETISRLGQYFMIKGRELEAAMKRETDPVDKERLRVKTMEFFRTSAEVFGRLSVRFPEHRLAAKTKLLSGENWLRAQEPKKAIAVYESLIENKKSPPDAVAQAMYWCGDAYLRIGEPTGAYRMFKVLTWDYPESGWARYARGRLLEDAVVAAEKKELEASKKEE
jgi:TolA-binding protein